LKLGIQIKNGKSGEIRIGMELVWKKTGRFINLDQLAFDLLVKESIDTATLTGCRGKKKKFS
jgi:hypothetical protein